MDMTPRQIVAYLDDYIIGQKDAKKDHSSSFKKSL